MGLHRILPGTAGLRLVGGPCHRHTLHPHCSRSPLAQYNSVNWPQVKTNAHPPWAKYPGSSVMLMPRRAVMIGSSRKTKKLCPRLPMELTTNRSKSSFSSARACLHRWVWWCVGWSMEGCQGGWAGSKLVG